MAMTEVAAPEETQFVLEIREAIRRLVNDDNYGYAVVVAHDSFKHCNTRVFSNMKKDTSDFLTEAAQQCNRPPDFRAILE